MTSPVGVLGGSGFYEFLDDVDDVVLDTPYGPPSSPIAMGSAGGRPVAFIARHGRDHRFLPHQVPYRANLWALREVGATSVVGPCSCGSLQPDVHPGDLVVLDQLVDRTTGRADSYCEGPPVQHVSFGEPYDEACREALVAAGRRLGLPLHPSGTVVVIQGPRFSTRAESRWFREMGWTVVNMTNYPEAVLARELGLPYASVALVTDYDAGVDGHPPVTMAEVFARVAENVATVRRLLVDALPALP